MIIIYVQRTHVMMMTPYNMRSIKSDVVSRLYDFCPLRALYRVLHVILLNPSD